MLPVRYYRDPCPVWRGLCARNAADGSLLRPWRLFRICAVDTHSVKGWAEMNTPSRPVAVTAISLFFFFGTLMSGLAALLLLFPGSRS